MLARSSLLVVELEVVVEVVAAACLLTRWMSLTVRLQTLKKPLQKLRTKLRLLPRARSLSLSSESACLTA